jgi:predicted DNA-binding transcriptional regulator YafY
MTAAELAAELEVSVRTVQRDVEALSAAGVPVYSERGRDGGYRLVDGYRSRLTGLDRDEAQAIVTFGAADPARQLGLGQALMSARLKLVAALPTPLREQALAAVGRFHLDAPGWFSARRPVPYLETLATGVFGDLVVDARYRGKSGSRSCRLEPLGLVLKAGNWYLVAAEGGTVRGYRADRVDQATVSEQHFNRPPGFDLGAFWTAWLEEFERSLPLVMVTVRARADRARRLRRVVEPAYADEVNWDAAPDNSGWVRLELPFEKLEYARAELLGFGTDVEVIEPLELRGEMTAVAAGLAALYGLTRPDGQPALDGQAMPT